MGHSIVGKEVLSLISLGFSARSDRFDAFRSNGEERLTAEILSARPSETDRRDLQPGLLLPVHLGPK
jgi:hypothetical protein